MPNSLSRISRCAGISHAAWRKIAPLPHSLVGGARCVDPLQIRRDGFPLFPRYEPKGVADLVHDAFLDLRVRIDRFNDFADAGQIIEGEDQDIFNPAIGCLPPIIHRVPASAYIYEILLPFLDQALQDIDYTLHCFLCTVECAIPDSLLRLLQIRFHPFPLLVCHFSPLPFSVLLLYTGQTSNLISKYGESFLIFI